MKTHHITDKDLTRILPILQDKSREFLEYFKDHKETSFLSEDSEIKGLISFGRLDWDTSIFGFNCSDLRYLKIFSSDNYEITFNSLIERVNSWIVNNEIRFMVAKKDPKDKRFIELMKKSGFNVIEELVALRHNLTSAPLQQKARYQIREFKQEDIEEIGEIASDSFAYTRFIKDKNFPEEKSRELNRKWAVNCCNGRSNNVLVADIEGRIAGFVTCNLESLPESNLKYGGIQLIAVQSEFRGKGIGRELTTAALNWFYKNDCNYVDISTQSDNYPALELYKKNGFDKISSRITMHRWI